MSMSASLQSESCTAIVLDRMQLLDGTWSVKIRYIDSMARPDLAGKDSAWLSWVGDSAPGTEDVVRFVPELKKSRLGPVWSGYVRAV
jgi:hypothetical protein